ncbi:MAG: hypothetical protein Q4C70_09445 [Planctomycetia bacterium]|nr:hypothetical protein [Planctomycetia bacterium]
MSRYCFISILIGIGIGFLLSLLLNYPGKSNQIVVCDSNLRNQVINDNVSKIVLQEKWGLELLNYALEPSSGNRTSDEEIFRGIVLDVAFQHAEKNPNLLPAYWQKVKVHLERQQNMEPIVKIGLLELFIEKMDEILLNSRSLEELKNAWEARQEADQYFRQMVNSEGEKNLLIFEKIGIHIRGAILQGNVADIEPRFILAATNLENLIDYIENPSWKERYLKLCIDTIEELLSETENRMRDFQKRLATMKEVTKSETFSPQKDKTDESWLYGETFKLLEEFQIFVQNYLNPEILKVIESYNGENANFMKRFLKLEKSSADFLRDTQRLNSIRYNLWANQLIYQSEHGDSGVALQNLAKISVELLDTSVGILFNERESALLSKLRASENIANAVQRVILTEKVPLSAF